MNKSFDDYLSIIASYFEPPKKNDRIYREFLWSKNCWCPEIARYAAGVEISGIWIVKPIIKIEDSGYLNMWYSSLSTAMTGLIRADQTKYYDVDELHETLTAFLSIKCALNGIVEGSFENRPMSHVSFWQFLYKSGIFLNSSLYYSPEMMDDGRHFFAWMRDNETVDDCLEKFICVNDNESIADIFTRVFKPLFPNLFTLGMPSEQWDNLDFTAMCADLGRAIQTSARLPVAEPKAAENIQWSEKGYSKTAIGKVAFKSAGYEDDKDYRKLVEKAAKDGEKPIKQTIAKYRNLVNMSWLKSKRPDVTERDLIKELNAT